MSRYAADTEVSIERSKIEIERTLARYGATGFGYMRDGYTNMVLFEVARRRVRFILTLPRQEEFRITESGRCRTEGGVLPAWEKACRQRWRALALVIKAKLEAVESGIVSFEEEFLAHILLPNMQTVGEWAQPQIEQVYTSGQMPRLLPGLPEGLISRCGRG